MTFVSKVIYKLKQYFGGYILRNPEDLLALDYIKNDRKYDYRHNYQLVSGDIVFDFGAHKGDWTEEILNRYPGVQCHLFELVPSYARKLRNKFAGMEQVRVNEFGLGSKHQHLQVNIAGLSSSSVNLVLEQPSETGVIRPLKHYLEEQNIDQIRLVKMNIEGGEYDLLTEMLDSGLFQNIGDIQIQFHNYGHEYPAMRDRIRERMARTHYLTYDYAWTFENWRRKKTD